MEFGPRAQARYVEGVGFTWAMSHTVTRGSREAKSKQCTGFRILEARRQSPQPKSATTRDAGLEVEGRNSSLVWSEPVTDTPRFSQCPTPTHRW